MTPLITSRESGENERPKLIRFEIEIPSRSAASKTAICRDTAVGSCLTILTRLIALRLKAGAAPLNYRMLSYTMNGWRHCISRLGLVPTLVLGTSLVAFVTPAQTPPPNDNFIDAISIDSTNTMVLGSNDDATKEPGEPDHAGNPGGKSVWWSWLAPATGYVTIIYSRQHQQFRLWLAVGYSASGLCR